jgi:hypothetical protein
LDVSNNMALEDLWCKDNGMTKLYVNNLQRYAVWDIDDGNPGLNVVVTLAIERHAGDVAILKGAGLLQADGTTERDGVALTWNLAGRLTEIQIEGANLDSTLSLSGLTELKFVSIWGTDCSSLNLSDLPNLEVLYCGGNNLRTLDMSGLTNLRDLSCGWNRLTTLDVSGCTALTTLSCVWNQLTKLNLFGTSFEDFESAHQSDDDPCWKYTYPSGAFLHVDQSVELLNVPRPVISTQPQSAIYIQNAAPTALSVVATGTENLFYQWYKDGVEITEATSDSYMPSTEMVGTAEYYCIVTLDGTSETTTSSTATITIVEEGTIIPDDPTLSAQPQSATYTQGQNATALFVTASGNGELSYQWYKDGAIITGAISNSYEPPTDTVGEVEYYCVVTNTSEGLMATTQSNTVTITVMAAEPPPLEKWIETPKGNGYKATVKGVKTLSAKKDADTTVSSIALKWTPKAKDAATTQIVIDVYAPKPKGKGTAAPLVATATIDVAAGECEYNGAKITVTKVGNSFKIVMSGLNPGTKYTVQMQAKNADGGLSKMTKTTAKTAKYTAVQKLKAVEKDQSSVTLNWSASKAPLPADADTRYEILWYEGKSKTPTALPETMTVTPVGVTGVKIEGLPPNTKYKFAVRAITTVDGHEIPSLLAKVSVKTLK